MLVVVVLVTAPVLGGCSTIATPLIQNEFLNIGSECIRKGGRFHMEIGSMASEVDCDLSHAKEK